MSPVASSARTWQHRLCSRLAGPQHVFGGHLTDVSQSPTLIQALSMPWWLPCPGSRPSALVWVLGCGKGRLLPLCPAEVEHTRGVRSQKLKSHMWAELSLGISEGLCSLSKYPHVKGTTA